MNYDDFLERKAIVHVPTGIESPKGTNRKLFPFQTDIVKWALRRGRASIFAGTGLGKTPMQCEWARHVSKYTAKPVLIFAPLAVASQTINEAQKILGLDVRFAESSADVVDGGLYITNYQKLHRFDCDAFGGVALDESSIIKHEDGAFRNALIESFGATPFKLACTATPAPNDFTEIGNHAEFMGSMSMSEMLSTFFVHDGGSTQDWRLKGHAEQDFYRWMASWSACLQRPSDLGYADEGYNLPALNTHELIVESGAPINGDLFTLQANTLQERRDARRASIGPRVQMAANLANNSDEQWSVWCNLNDESAALTAAIPGAVEVKGGDSDEHKTRSMLDFASGKIRVLVSKASICGFGMNFQSCRNTAFVGLSDSFEQYYQAVRRHWRFGQSREVNAYIIISDAEGAVLKNIKRKQADAETMQRNLVAHMAEITKKELKGSARTILEYKPTQDMILPKWLLTSATACPNLQ